MASGAATSTPDRPLTPDVVLMFVTKVAVLALNVGGTIITARALGPTGRGSIAVALSFTLLLIQFGSLGMQSANPYFSARDPRAIPRVVANAVWFSFGLGMVLILIGAAVKWQFPSLLRGLAWGDVLVVLAGLPVLLANQLLQSVLLAEGRVRAYNGIELAQNVAVFSGLFVVLVVAGGGVLAALVVMIGANTVSACTYYALLRGHSPPLRRPDRVLMQAMLRYGFRIYVTTLIAFLVGRINLVLVNSYLGTAAAGQFSIAIAIAEGMHLLPSVVAVNLFPRIARGEPTARSAAVFRTLTVLFGAVCLITIPLARPGITFLYGGEFSEAAVIYLWLLPGIFAYGMLNVLSYHFAGRGFPLEAMLIWIPGLALNLVLVFLLVPGGTATMAALAASVGYVVVLAFHMQMFARESGGLGSLVPKPRETVEMLRGAAGAMRRRTP